MAGGTGVTLTFTTSTLPVVPSKPGSGFLEDDTTAHIVQIPTLQAIRNLEMTAMGRFYIDEEGNATYEDRFARNP